MSATLTDVELFERGGGWVAAGDAEQWANTHARLESFCEHSIETYAHAEPWSRPDNYADDLRRIDRVKSQAWEAIFWADRAGRCSVELFASEAEIIRQALA